MEEGPASFGRIKALDADGQGRIWVLDNGGPEIRIFEPEGAYLSTLGRKGKGPGEFSNPEGMAFAPDGRLWVRDAEGARFQVFSSEGNFEQSWSQTFCFRYHDWAPRIQAERIVDIDCAIAAEQAQLKRVIFAYRTDLSGVDTIGVKPECGTQALNDAATYIREVAGGRSFWSVPFAPTAHEAVGDDGELWCVPNSSRFEVLRLVPGSTDTLRVTAAVADVAVTTAERDSAIAELEKPTPKGFDYGRIPALKPVIDRVIMDDVGQLWVQSTDAAGVLEFRVFSKEGKAVGIARLSGHRLERGTPFVVRGNALYATAEDHEGTPIVLRFAIGRATK